MGTLLAFNDNAILVGDRDGRVRTESRPAELSRSEWEERLRFDYLEPEHWYKDEEGMPFSHYTGGYWDENGQMKAEVIEGVKPYEDFSDEVSGLSIRATFLLHIHQWVLADKEREPSDEIE